MKMKKLFLALFATAMFNLPALMAQDLTAAADAFNQGLQFSRDGNHTEALNQYKKTMEMCAQLGDEGVELGLKAEQQLPGAYFNVAKGLFDEKKYTEAIPNFEESARYADQMGETKTADASRTYLAGIYTALGNAGLKAEKLPEAINDYNKAIGFKPDYYKAYYGLGLVYKKQDDLPKMKEALDQVISMGGQDSKTIDNAKNAAASAYLNAGAKALQSKNYTEASENLQASLEYDAADAKAYYYLALARNGAGNWDEAIAAATKALELQTEDKSDIYFELGKSYEKKGDNAAACDAYKKVTSGNNVEPARYQVEQVLKCN